MTKCFCDKCGKELSIESAELHFSLFYEALIEERKSTTTGRGRKKQIRTSITEKKIPQIISINCDLCKDCGLKLYDFLNKLGDNNNEMSLCSKSC